LKELAKFYANLLFDFDHHDITFREDAITLGELLIHLGIDPVVVKEHWLGHHPMKQALVGVKQRFVNFTVTVARKAIPV
jgi:hypothetical protein